VKNLDKYEKVSKILNDGIATLNEVDKKELSTHIEKTVEKFGTQKYERISEKVTKELRIKMDENKEKILTLDNVKIGIEEAIKKHIDDAKTKTLNFHLHAHTFPGIPKANGLTNLVQVRLSIRL
jgi:hypothetical protein